MTAVLTAVTGDGRGDVADRLAAARAALTRAETATGLRTRLGGPTSVTGLGGPTSITGLGGPTSAGGPGGPASAGGPGGPASAGGPGGPTSVVGLGERTPADGPGRLVASGSLAQEGTSRWLHGPGTDQTLPVPAALAPLFPGGALPRGSVVHASGSTSVLLALAAAAGAEGAWCALAALPHVGWRAAAGAGLALDRVAVVPAPGPDAAGVVGALVDGFDVLVVGRCPALSDRDRRSLAARVRTRGAVLLTSHDWPGANQVLHATRTGWDGIGQGWGHLGGQDLAVRATGRGAASGVREVRVHVGRDGLLGGASAQAVSGEAAPMEKTAGFVRPLLRAV